MTAWKNISERELLVLSAVFERLLRNERFNTEELSCSSPIKVEAVEAG